MNIHEILLKYWRYTHFRPLQEQIIHSVLDGKDTLALMPTGGGKSLCYQIPALSRPGICIVISPLIALMRDQVERLQARKIKAVAVFAGMRKREIDIALDNCIYDPEVKFLYLSPERLQTELLQERIRYMQVNLIAVDEAHCISQWGYDFRPSYLQIALLRALLPQVPVLAVTATATREVLKDIQEKLLFRPENTAVFQAGFAREKLIFAVLQEQNKSQRVLQIIQKVGGSGIIYVRNRRETRELSQFLVQQGIRADFYHAGLDTPGRHAKQKAWTQGITRIMVATHAFGMGIDKADVRLVAHMDIPPAPEAYYQEAGRAGRDGEKAYAVLLYDQSDIQELEQRFIQSFPTHEVIAQTYYNLGNYYQLAYGAGAELAFDFDVQDFCKRFKQHPIQTMQAIAFLAHDGWLSLSEQVYLPARFRFEVNQSEVYKFQVEHERWDRLIKALLRTYGGAFEQFTSIEETDIARKISWTTGQVKQGMETLQELELLRYIPRSDRPQLTFLRPRSDTAHLSIDMSFVHTRKQIARQQLDAMLDYLQGKACRVQRLLAYFNVEEAPCGICDNCLRRRKETRGQKTPELIETYLLDQLKSGSKSLEQLMEPLPQKQREICFECLNNLVNKGTVKLNMQRYYLA